MGGIEDAGPEIYDGGMAFPGVRRYHGADVHEDGCTKRDLFSAIILAGMTSNEVDNAAEGNSDRAVKLADALLRRLRHP